MSQTTPSADRITLRLAEPADREDVARLRYQVYALELGQYAANAASALHDPEDVATQYLVASAGGALVGCVGVTPPDSPRFGLDRYWDRAALPIALTPATHEIRVLTVLPAQRGSIVAAAMMYAAFRWIEDRGGNQIVAMGRQEWLDMYQALGLRPCGATVASGAVRYDLVAAPVAALRSERDGRRELIRRIGRACDWRLPVPFAAAPACFHGGAFFEAIGMTFDRLERRDAVINADVLDAWFPPAPGVLAALRYHLDWLAPTSPPTNADGLRQTIAAARSLPAECVLPGGGSSDLIFLALRHWLGRRSRALLLDPCYGEYAHVLEQVIGCQVDRLSLRRDAGYAVDLAELAERARAGYDLIVLVNPNNPTGRHIPPAELLPVLAAAQRCGAVCVIAHPGRRDGFVCFDADLLDQLRAEVPIDGIEAHYPAHSPEQTAMYVEYAAKHNLLVSAGSDSHGPNKPPIKYPARLCAGLLERLGVRIA